MREASLRAARQPRKGGLSNALYLVAAAEELPGPLRGTVDLLTIVLPWGSLLRGLATPEPALLARLRATLRPSGQLELLLSVEPSDRSLQLAPLDEVAVGRLLEAYEAAGLGGIESRAATAADVARLGSSWARRLGVPDRRPAWLLRFGREHVSCWSTVEPRGGEGASVGSSKRRRWRTAPTSGRR